MFLNIAQTMLLQKQFVKNLIFSPDFINSILLMLGFVVAF